MTYYYFFICVEIKVANEALLSMRTISAFNMQWNFVEKYDKLLDAARVAGIKKGFVTGVSIGAVFFFMQLTWALGKKNFFFCSDLFIFQFPISNLFMTPLFYVQIFFFLEYKESN